MHREEPVGIRQADGPWGAAADRLVSVFCETFGISSDKVHPDLGPDDLKQWDSIGYVMLVAAIEEAFSIQLDVDEIMEMTSFRATLAVLETKLR